MKNPEQMLHYYRLLRGFDVETYVDAKVTAINKFFEYNKLDSAVLGISGGIDSAVTLYLLDRASKVEGSPLKKILPLSIPIYEVSGVTSQREASSNARIVMENLGFDYVEIPIASAYKAIIKNSMYVVEGKKNWAEGQMASILRTPILYYHTAILQTEGYKSIVIGTTNRDEGSYIGFFGKASDAMVDLQPIADIHKSEVYQVAEFLDVPNCIINRTPKGDVWDGRNDTDMIGATYDDLELFLLSKEYGIKCDDWSEDLKEHFRIPFDNIEKLHKINEHKYKVGNPAHFIDVINRKVIGGWM